MAETSTTQRSSSWSCRHALVSAPKCGSSHTDFRPALFRAINLHWSEEKSLKSTLLVITLWFRHGSHPTVLAAIRQNLSETQMRPWLSVVPQLIARLGAKDIALRESLVNFLVDISHAFPDAVCWPLLTAAQTPHSVHQTAAKNIMRQMELTSRAGEMVKEVSRMTIREFRS